MRRPREWSVIRLNFMPETPSDWVGPPGLRNSQDRDACPRNTDGISSFYISLTLGLMWIFESLIVLTPSPVLSYFICSSSMLSSVSLESELSLPHGCDVLAFIFMHYMSPLLSLSKELCLFPLSCPCSIITYWVCGKQITCLVHMFPSQEEPHRQY